MPREPQILRASSLRYRFSTSKSPIYKEIRCEKKLTSEASIKSRSSPQSRSDRARTGRKRQRTTSLYSKNMPDRRMWFSFVPDLRANPLHGSDPRIAVRSLLMRLKGLGHSSFRRIMIVWWCAANEFAKSAFAFDPSLALGSLLSKPRSRYRHVRFLPPSPITPNPQPPPRKPPAPAARCTADPAGTNHPPRGPCAPPGWRA